MQVPRRRPFRIVRGMWLLPLLGVWLSNATSASAAADIPEPDLSADSRLVRTGPVNVLPESVAATVSDDRATATTWAGYDGAKRAPLLAATVEARILGRLVLLAGAGTTGQTSGSTGLRPQVGLRLQILDQSRHGLDGAAAVMYRQDQFTTEGGFYQAAVALQRRQGRLLLVMNLLYGQDGEGDDRQGEARLAAMLSAGHGLLFGVDGRYRHDLWSDDARGPSSDRPVAELVAGPTASFRHGTWAVMAEGGVSAVQSPATRTGLIALAGFASCF